MPKITFQVKWLEEFPWVQEGKIKGDAVCSLCKKNNINYGSMGRSALQSHARGKKHREREDSERKTVPLKTFFVKSSAESSSNSLAGPSQATPSSINESTAVLSSSSGIPLPACGTSVTALPAADQTQQPLPVSKWWKVNEKVTEAEALWCIQTAICHHSLRAAESSVKLFKRMFADSPTALDMKLGKDKISYSIVYGIAPYFKNKILSEIKKCEYFVVGFDESLNKYAQKQQMDVVVRFWSESKNEVCTRYLTSVFLHNTTADDLLKGLKEALFGLDIKKVVQLSMDGPNVNLKLLKLLRKEIEEEHCNVTKMLDIGSCGLHVVNVSFKTGIKNTKWNLINFLRSCYYLFKDSPSRRGEYIRVTGSNKFPKKMCSVRWLENSSVAKCALEIFDDIVKFVEHVPKTKKMKNTEKCSSFKSLVVAFEDKLLRAKLGFFSSLAEDLESFLREFQTDAPMTPFLYGNLVGILKLCMGRIVKDEVLQSKPLHQIDLANKENLKTAKEIDIGYATRSALKKCSRVKDAEILKFRQDCRTCLVSVCEKLLQKCPLKYPLTKALTFLDPCKAAFSSQSAVEQMSAALDIIVTSNLIPASVAQSADREYRDLISEPSVNLQLKSYKRDVKLDAFWTNLLKNKEMDCLRRVIHLLLPLSHGNATLERGFSINGDVLIENLKEESLVAQRVIYDAVMDAGSLDNITVTKEMVLSMRNANHKWKQALRDQREALTAEAKEKAEKRKADALTKELERKKRILILESQKQVEEIEEKIKELKKNT